MTNAALQASCTLDTASDAFLRRRQGGCGEQTAHLRLPGQTTIVRCLGKLGMNDVGVLLPLVLLHPHLERTSASCHNFHATKLTFLNVLSPARMLPPVHVV